MKNRFAQKRNINFIFTLFLIVAIFLKTKAQDRQLPNISDKKLSLENQWSATKNINAKLFNSFIPLGSFEINYNGVQGDFKPVQISDKESNYGFRAEKTMKFDKILFFGNIEYKNQAQKQVTWTARMHVPNDNPYMLADSMSGLYKKNYIRLNGGLAYQINENMTSGVAVNYKVANGARIKDPRPENTLYSLAIMPSMIYTLGKLKLGTTLHWQRGREYIRYEVIEPMVSYRMFRLLGLGKGKKTINNQFYTRNYYKKNMGADLEIQYNFGKNNLLFVSKYHHKKEKAEDGTTVPRKGDAGNFLENQISSYLIFNRKANYFQQFKLSFDYQTFTGTEFVEKAYLDDAKITRYKVITTLDNYSQNKITPAFTYILGLGNQQYYYKWLLTINTKYETNNTLYVNEAEKKLQNISGNIAIDRVFEFEKLFLNISLLAIYAKNLSNELKQLRAYNAPQDKAVWEQITLPDFYFETASAYSFGINVKFGKTIKLKKIKKTNLYCDLQSYMTLAEVNNNQQRRTIYSITIGMNF